MINTDICIVGAGPVGLFAIFEAGLLKMRCHLVDVLPKIGGQLVEIYPKKPIYDIPGYPTILAEELVQKLDEQAAPFKPTFTLGERVETFSELPGGGFRLTTSAGTHIESKVVVIAGGLGCFEPRKPEIENLELFEGKGVNYMVVNPEVYRGKRVVIAGGGDSALDWTLFLAEICDELTLVHRGTTFRGAPASAARVQALAEAGKIKLKLKANVTALAGNGKLNEVIISPVETKESSATTHRQETDYLIPLFGLSPKLGPLEQWGLNLDKNAIVVNPEDFSTNVPGIYAIGDINTYPGKLKLILCGFHEAALMCHGAFKRINPESNLVLKYTTVNGIQAF